MANSKEKYVDFSPVVTNGLSKTTRRNVTSAGDAFLETLGLKKRTQKKGVRVYIRVDEQSNGTNVKRRGINRAFFVTLENILWVKLTVPLNQSHV